MGSVRDTKWAIEDTSKNPVIQKNEMYHQIAEIDGNETDINKH